MDRNECLARKYIFLRDKIIKHYHKGCNLLNTVKIIVAVLFVLFTILAIILANRSGNKGGWLIGWIVVILLNIAVFTVTDYCKYLVKDKVIPYLEDDEQLEFGEYDIFIDNDDDENEEENEDEYDSDENAERTDD